MRRLYFLIPAFLFALLPGPSRAEQQSLDRTAPPHFEAFPVSPWPPDWLYPFRATPIRPERIVYRLKGSVRQVAKVDPVLSKACRRGAFVQRLNWIFRVQSADDRPYGIGWGSGVNLHDPEKRSTLDKVYLFDRQDTGLCAVWVAPLETLRRYLDPSPAR
ncbi:hypothetical protein JL101_000245 [Skermanella rosea]|uniref:hypothetical protein n=1 Tax=Skermanella rosea TaxID=1817965 RepID=UPI0019332FE2|nr:hypothetical protein [Skermanella rosea]UEM03913.1 hypothetical protein JL101_000245 [Skermanella rosea]